jgi:hypothetical protein
MAKLIEISKPYEPLYLTKKPIILITGGRGCFDGNQEVVTSLGSKPISEINKNDLVLSFDGENKSFKKVIELFKYDNDKILNIKLKNGTIIKVTSNHEFFFNGCWIKIKDLLSLWDERRNMDSDKEV